MVLYRVVGTARQKLGNLCPLVAILTVANVEDPFLFAAPRVLFNHWIQMVVPTLTALLANPTIKMLSNLSPLLGAFFLDQS